MNRMSKKIYWGIWFIIWGIGFALYAFKPDLGLYDIPLYKLLFITCLTASIISKLIFGLNLREKIKSFFPISLIFALLEKNIEEWTAGNFNYNIWALMVAGILIDIALTFMVPKTALHKFNPKNGDAYHSDAPFGNHMHYVDADKTKKAYFKNIMGCTHIFYQNADIADPAEPLEITLYNQMGKTVVHVPSDWVVTNRVYTSAGKTTVRPNTGNGLQLTVTGENKMGSITFDV